MSIFNINNRSESWSISRQFILGGHDLSRELANRVVSNTGQKFSGKVDLELFWTGFRDYCQSKSITIKDKGLNSDVETAYIKRFSNLYEKVGRFNKCNKPKLKVDSSKHNYILNNKSRGKLVANLYHTEIDIVICAGDCLLIGEVKLEVGFSSNSKYVLVHQLIRQYVMATILMDILNMNGQNVVQVIPFVITERDVSKTAQVKFMVESGWLHLSNIFDWSVLESRRV